jgi:hypothetical protein
VEDVGADREGGTELEVRGPYYIHYGYLCCMISVSETQVNLTFLKVIH